MGMETVKCIAILGVILLSQACGDESETNDVAIDSGSSTVESSVGDSFDANSSDSDPIQHDSAAVDSNEHSATDQDLVDSPDMGNCTEHEINSNACHPSSWFLDMAETECGAAHHVVDFSAGTRIKYPLFFQNKLLN